MVLSAPRASDQARSGPSAALQPAPRSACCRAGGARAALVTAFLGEHVTCSWHMVLAGQGGLGSDGEALEMTAGQGWCRRGPPARRTAGVGIPASMWPGCLGATSARLREHEASCVLADCHRHCRAGGCCAGPRSGVSVPPRSSSPPLSRHLSFTQASELGHSLNENVLKPAQEKVTPLRHTSCRPRPVSGTGDAVQLGLRPVCLCSLCVPRVLRGLQYQTQ